MRRHFERAQFHQSTATRRTVGRIELVDAELGAVRVAGHVRQQVTEHAIDQPGRRILAFELREGDREFVDVVVTRFVDARRLTRRSDEQAGEQIRERRVIVPVGDETAQQIRPPQERAVGRRVTAEYEVITAARADVAPVEHELFGRQPRLVRFVVQDARVPRQLVPAARRLDIDLDDAGVRRDLEVRQTRIGRRGIPFEHHRQIELSRGGFNRADQAQVVLERRNRRQEHVEHAVARFGAQRRADDRRGRLVDGRDHRCAWRGWCRESRRCRGCGRSVRFGGTAGQLHAWCERGSRRQRWTRFHGIESAQIRIVRLAHPRQRIDRQPIAHRRIAGNQEQMFGAQEPRARSPCARSVGRGCQRQRVADDV